MTFVGVDPHWAKPYAVTAVAGCGKILLQAKCELASLYRVLEDLRRAGDEPVLAVEDQYMAKNYNVAKKLSWSAGKAMGVAELLGLPCVTVNVATWKARMRAQKGRHVEVSEALGGVPDDDLASSHLIAEHARRTWTE